MLYGLCYVLRMLSGFCLANFLNNIKAASHEEKDEKEKGHT